MHEVWAIVVAAGSGTRFGDQVPKQFAELGGLRVIDWAVAAAEAACQGVVAVVPSDNLDVSLPPTVTVVAGGASRAASVRAGLAAIPDDAAVIAEHLRASVKTGTYCVYRPDRTSARPWTAER